MKVTVLIMAGGKGERFWPKGRRALPKQFLNLTDKEKTMIRLTAERIMALAQPENIFIISNESYKKLIEEQVPFIPKKNIICEPEGRDTAPCIGLGAMHIRKRYPDEDPVMVVLPADHLIKDDAAFAETMKRAIAAASRQDGLITFGIRPSYPETGYGYIKYDSGADTQDIYTVAEFTEKPDRETAGDYFKSRDYLWNSGMFIWRLSVIESAFEKYMPDTYAVLETIGSHIDSEDETTALKENFSKTEKISIDYGIMEKADNIYTIPCKFGWDDVGTWDALERVYDTDIGANLTIGKTVLRDTKKSIIVNDTEDLVCVMGADDLVVVKTKDAVLVCPKNRTGEIKQLIKDIENKGLEKFL